MNAGDDEVVVSTQRKRKPKKFAGESDDDSDIKKVLKHSLSTLKKAKTKKRQSQNVEIGISDQDGLVRKRGRPIIAEKIGDRDAKVTEIQEILNIEEVSKEYEMQDAICKAISESSHLPYSPSMWHSIGCWCSVFWEDDDTWFGGRVLLHDECRNRYFVHYIEDLTVEWVDFDKMAISIIDKFVFKSLWPVKVFKISKSAFQWYKKIAGYRENCIFVEYFNSSYEWCNDKALQEYDPKWKSKVKTKKEAMQSSYAALEEELQFTRNVREMVARQCEKYMSKCSASAIDSRKVRYDIGMKVKMMSFPLNIIVDNKLTLNHTNHSKDEDPKDITIDAPSGTSMVPSGVTQEKVYHTRPKRHFNSKYYEAIEEDVTTSVDRGELDIYTTSNCFHMYSLESVNPPIEYLSKYKGVIAHFCPSLQEHFVVFDDSNIFPRWVSFSNLRGRGGDVEFVFDPPMFTSDHLQQEKLKTSCGESNKNVDSIFHHQFDESKSNHLLEDAVVPFMNEIVKESADNVLFCRLCSRGPHLIAHGTDGDDMMRTCSKCKFRSFHTYCMSSSAIGKDDPASKDDWRCWFCVYCDGNGCKTSSWNSIPKKVNLKDLITDQKSNSIPEMELSLCSPCINKYTVTKSFCGICYKLYDDMSVDKLDSAIMKNKIVTKDTSVDEDSDVMNDAMMVFCDACHNWVHAACDGIDVQQFRAIGRNEHPIWGEEYLCPGCRICETVAMIGTLKMIDATGLFAEPVTVKVAPTYRDIVRQPMDFRTMTIKAESGKYKSLQAVRSDFELMCFNAILFNKAGDEYWNETSSIHERGMKAFENHKRKTSRTAYGVELLEKLEDFEQSRKKNESSFRKRGSSYLPNANISSDSKPKSRPAPVKQSFYTKDDFVSFDGIGATTSKRKRLSIEEKAQKSSQNNITDEALILPNADIELPSNIKLPTVVASDKYPLVNNLAVRSVAPEISFFECCEDLCGVCASAGDSKYFLFCTCCGECYHSYCLEENDPSLGILVGQLQKNCKTEEVLQNGWLCKNCILCDVCNTVGSEDTMFCRGCWKIVHRQCISPPLLKPLASTVRWYCAECVDCNECLFANNAKSDRNIMGLTFFSTPSFAKNNSYKSIWGFYRDKCVKCDLVAQHTIKAKSTCKYIIPPSDKCHYCYKEIKESETLPTLYCLCCFRAFHIKCDSEIWKYYNLYNTRDKHKNPYSYVNMIEEYICKLCVSSKSMHQITSHIGSGSASWNLLQTVCQIQQSLLQREMQFSSLIEKRRVLDFIESQKAFIWEYIAVIGWAKERLTLLMNCDMKNIFSRISESIASKVQPVLEWVYERAVDYVFLWTSKERRSDEATNSLKLRLFHHYDLLSFGFNLQNADYHILLRAGLYCMCFLLISEREFEVLSEIDLQINMLPSASLFTICKRCPSAVASPMVTNIVNGIEIETIEVRKYNNYVFLKTFCQRVADIDPFLVQLLDEADVNMKAENAPVKVEEVRVDATWTTQEVTPVLQHDTTYVRVAEKNQSSLMEMSAVSSTDHSGLTALEDTTNCKDKESVLDTQQVNEMLIDSLISDAIPSMETEILINNDAPINSMLPSPIVTVGGGDEENVQEASIISSASIVDESNVNPRDELKYLHETMIAETSNLVADDNRMSMEDPVCVRLENMSTSQLVTKTSKKLGSTKSRVASRAPTIRTRYVDIMNNDVHLEHSLANSHLHEKLANFLRPLSLPSKHELKNMTYLFRGWTQVNIADTNNVTKTEDSQLESSNIKLEAEPQYFQMDDIDSQRNNVSIADKNIVLPSIQNHLHGNEAIESAKDQRVDVFSVNNVPLVVDLKENAFAATEAADLSYNINLGSMQTTAASQSITAVDLPTHCTVSNSAADDSIMMQNDIAPIAECTSNQVGNSPPKQIISSQVVASKLSIDSTEPMYFRQEDISDSENCYETDSHSQYYQQDDNLDAMPASFIYDDNIQWESYRICVFCKDSLEDEDVGRILPLPDGSRFAHLNCMRYCFGTKESKDGCIEIKDNAVVRALETKCALCHETGASVQCKHGQCNLCYHLKCAIACGCSFSQMRLKSQVMSYGVYNEKKEKFSQVTTSESIGEDIYYFSTCMEHTKLSRKLISRPPYNSLRAIKTFIANNRAKEMKNGDELRLGTRMLRAGALTIQKLGTPSMDDPGHHSEDSIFPIGFRSCRIFWSAVYPLKRTLYSFEIQKNSTGHDFNGLLKNAIVPPIFVVMTSDSKSVITSTSIQDCFDQLIDRVVKVNSENYLSEILEKRRKINALKFNASSFFGLSLAVVRYAYESMPDSIAAILPQVFFSSFSNSESLPCYKPYFVLPNKYQYINAVRKQARRRAVLRKNLCGSSRAEGYVKDQVSYGERRRVKNLAKAVDSEYEDENSTIARLNKNNSSGNSRNSKNSKSVDDDDMDNADKKNEDYERDELGRTRERLETKYWVMTLAYQRNPTERLEVRRSPIHGWGLFAKVSIPEDSMIVEYIGEVIRQPVADKREVVYEEEGMGSCYLFRLDRSEIVDATKTGGMARFMNHCCEPCAYAKIITTSSNDPSTRRSQMKMNKSNDAIMNMAQYDENDFEIVEAEHFTKHIVIMAARHIKAGEEITYDYKFPIEDTKLKCFCGAPKCCGTMN